MMARKLKVNLMWANAELYPADEGGFHVRIRGRRRRKDGSPGAEMEIWLNDCGFGVKKMIFDFAEAENKRLEQAKDYHEHQRDQLSRAWNKMGD